MRFSSICVAALAFALIAGFTTLAGQTPASKLDPFDNPSVLDEATRSEFREIANAVKDVRLWKRMGGLSPEGQVVPKSLINVKPDAIYRTKLSMPEFLPGTKPHGRWAAVEVKRFGHLLLAFVIDGQNTAENYSYVGYDKAGNAAGRVDTFYLAIQNENLRDVHELSDELSKSGKFDFDMECAWWGLESRVGDKKVAARLQSTVDARKDPLVPVAFYEKALVEGKYGVIELLSYRIEQHSVGCANR